MEKIPTTEEFLKTKGVTGVQANTISIWMVVFTKLHVEAALKEASEKVSGHSVTPVMGGTPIFKKVRIDGKSILNAYPLSNIK